MNPYVRTYVRSRVRIPSHSLPCSSPRSRLGLTTYVWLIVGVWRQRGRQGFGGGGGVGCGFFRRLGLWYVALSLVVLYGGGGGGGDGSARRGGWWWR